MSSRNPLTVKTVPEEGSVGSLPDEGRETNLAALMRGLNEPDPEVLPADVSSHHGGLSVGSEITSGSYQFLGRPDAMDRKTPTGFAGNGKLTHVNVEWMRDHCGGIIGGGDRVCAKLLGDCNTKAHQIHKTDQIVPGYLYLPGAGSSIFVSPSFSFEGLLRVEAVDVGALLSDNHSTDEWIRICHQITSSPQYQAYVSPKSPGATGKVSPSFGEPSSPLKVDTSFSDEDREEVMKNLSKPSPTQGAQIDSISDSTMRSVLQGHDYKISLNSGEIRKLAESAEQHRLSIRVLQGDVELLEDLKKSHMLLYETVGVRPPMFDDVTLWEGLAAKTTPQVASSSSDIKNLAAATHKLLQRVKVLELSARKSGAAGLSTASGANAATSPTSVADLGIQQELDLLNAKVAVLEERERIANSLTPQLTGKMEVMEKSLNELRKLSVGGNFFSYAGKEFGSVQDVELLLYSSLGEANVGCFNDIFGVLSQIGEKFYDGNDYANYLHASVWVKATTLKTATMSQMAAPNIRYFFEASNKAGLVPQDQGFGHRLSAIDKYSGANPQRYEIIELIDRILTTTEGAIVGEGSSQLARHLCTRCKIQVESLLGFIEQYHGELLVQCNYNTKEAWPFVGQCVRSVMEYLVPPRVKVSGLQEFQSRENKAKIIWAVLQAHMRMDAIIEAKFKSHHTLTTVMSNFIMKTRVSESSVTDLTKKVKEVSSVTPKMASLEAELKALKASMKKK